MDELSLESTIEGLKRLRSEEWASRSSYESSADRDRLVTHLEEYKEGGDPDYIRQAEIEIEHYDFNLKSCDNNIATLTSAIKYLHNIS